MKINELKPAVLVPEPAWKSQLREFWSQAGDHDQIDMQVMLKMGDLGGAQALLETWHQQVAERKKKKKKKSSSRGKFQYGNFGGWFYPGYDNQSGADAGAGEGGGGESIQEQTQDIDSIIDRFSKSCADYLELQNPPAIRLRRDPEWTRRNGTFGRYTAGDDQQQIELATAGRHIIDILRTLAHEMTHALQNQRSGLPDNAGETGSPWEDEANAMAGRIMRHWADHEPEMFAGVELEENWRQTGRVDESSGYIPVDQKEAKDPRYSMAVTVDIKPGEPQRQAAKMGWKISRAGVPPVLKTNGNQ
jgi:hypothetical protein